MTTPIAPGVGANLLGQHSAERNQYATAYVGNLDPLASQDKKSLDIGANLFIGNLGPDVDEEILYNTFSAFRIIVGNLKIMRDPDTGNTHGLGFISYDSFDASDSAIETMNGQYLCNRQITVSYAYKKDTKGERHGTPAERVLAASNPGAQESRPHTMFASGPPSFSQANDTAPPTLRPPLPPFANGSIPPPPSLSMFPPPPLQAMNMFTPMPAAPPSWLPGQQPMPMPPQCHSSESLPTTCRCHLSRENLRSGSIGQHFFGNAPPGMHMSIEQKQPPPPPPPPIKLILMFTYYPADDVLLGVSFCFRIRSSRAVSWAKIWICNDLSNFCNLFRFQVIGLKG